MRTSLSLSTLFAVSLIGGSALAEKPGAGGREPHAIEAVRSHGDIVDKSYAAPQAQMHAGAAATATRTLAPTQPAHAVPDRGASRVNCSDTGVDCAAHGGSQQSVAQPSAASTGRAVQMPAALDKLLGSERTNFNEAGEDQGMSPRAANRAWAGSAAHHSAGAGAAVPLAQQQQVDRLSQQRSTARVSCNEADECSMSNKASRTEWAHSSIKAGTWTGPAKEPVSNAARRIAGYRAAESASLHDEKVAHHEADHAGGGHAGGAATAGEQH
jgi:hypothetical protein